MASTTYSTFDPAPAETRRLNRAITWSIAVHVGVIALVLFTPRSWWSNTPEQKTVMTVSLGGSPGPRTSGQTSVGGRTVEEVAPPPRRPETVRPTPPTPPAPTAAPPVRTPPRPATATSKPTTRPAPPTSTTKPKPQAPATAGRAPVTGQAVTQGNTAVDTGASGQGAGLASGGRLSGGETDLANFCCPAYLDSMTTAIDSRWNKNQPERGTTTLKFTVTRDGSITNITIEQQSGYGVLDRAARAALIDARLPPLPADYTRETLTVYLKFPYGAL